MTPSFVRSPSDRGSGGIIFVLLTLVSWSSIPLFLKYFAGYLDGWTANGWRYGIAAVMWCPFLIVSAYRRRLPRGLWRAAVVPSLFNCCGQTCFAWSPYFIEPGMLTFLLRFHIIFVTLGAFLLFPSERRILRSRHYWAGIAITFLGSIGVVFLAPEMPHGATAFGTALAILSGVFFAGYIVSVRYYMEGVSPITAFAAISAYTATGLIGMMVILGRSHGLGVAVLNAEQWLSLIVSALVGIAVAHVFYYAGIARVGVSVASGIILLQPVLTSTASYFFFGELLTIGQWCSGMTALLGGLIVLGAQRRIQRTRSRSVSNRGPCPNLRLEPATTGTP